MKHLGTTRLFILLLVLSPLAFPFQSPAGSGDVEPNEGRVSDGVYVSNFFGFTYEIPQGLIPQSTEFKQHLNDPSRPPAKTFVLFLAATPVKPYKNIAIQATYNSAGFRDGAAYLEKVATSSVKIGLTVLDSPQEKVLAGKTFFRQNYYSPQGTFFQTHVCILSKGYVLDFVISAHDHEDIEKIFNSLNTLKFGTGEATIAISQDGGAGIPHWDRGRVEGRTYKNASVGIELSPPPGLEFGAPELKGNPGTDLLVTITAVGEVIPLMTRNVMAFYADALAYYPSARRSTDAYMLRIVRGQQNEGFEPVASAANAKLGDVFFERQDFKKGVVYESILVKACDAQALVFIFGTADQDAANKLIAAVELKVDSAIAECSSNALTPNQK